MRESNTMLSLTYTFFKTGQPSYIHSLLSFPSNRCTQSSSLITLSCPSLTSRLKIANRSYYHSAPVLWNNFPSDLHAAHHVTLSPIFNSPVSDLSASLLKPISFTLPFLLSLYSPNLSQDWISGIDQASLFHLTHVSISFTVISFRPILFYLTCLWISSH